MRARNFSSAGGKNFIPQIQRSRVQVNSAEFGVSWICSELCPVSCVSSSCEYNRENSPTCNLFSFQWPFSTTLLSMVHKLIYLNISSWVYPSVIWFPFSGHFFNPPFQMDFVWRSHLPRGYNPFPFLQHTILKITILYLLYLLQSINWVHSWNSWICWFTKWWQPILSLAVLRHGPSRKMAEHTGTTSTPIK